MTIAVCVVTRNRPAMLERCLYAVQHAQRRPDLLLVSDDSSDESRSAATRAVTTEHAVAYLAGPRRGVCANRNNCLHLAANSDVIVFLDDDTLLEPDFLANVERAYSDMRQSKACKTILVGVRYNEHGKQELPSRLNFRGYFEPAENPHVAGASYSAYPTAFFAGEKWDENIYYGYEDAELSLRALERGYELKFSPNLKALDIGREGSLDISLQSERVLLESARLYVGVKRYLRISRDLPRLAGFVILYVTHLAAHLLRTRALSQFPAIVRAAKLETLLKQ